MTMLEQLSQELETLAARTAPAVVRVEHRSGQGSGLVLAQDGYVLTNRHVVQGARRVQIVFHDGSDSTGRLVGADARTDLAVLRVDGSGLTSLPLAERLRVKVGQLVLAIGNPLRFERSVSLGVVSALDRSLPTPDGHLFEGMIQTDAAINPGNSGGPLVTMDGAVAGINTAIIPYAQGIGFAVPAHTANWVVGVLMQKGRVLRPILGINALGVELASEGVQQYGQPRAVRVFQVSPNSPADDARLREGDLILAANGSPLASIDDLQRVMVLSGERKLDLDVVRKDKRQHIVVTPLPPAEAA